MILDTLHHLTSYQPLSLLHQQVPKASTPMGRTIQDIDHWIIASLMLSLLHAARRSRPCQTPLQGMKALKELVDDVGEDVVNICQVRVL